MKLPRPEGWQRNVWALTLIVFVAFVGFQFFSPFLPLYIRERGVTDPGGIALWSGVLSAVTPAISGVLSPVFGRLADRFGRKMMLVRSLVGFIVIIAAMGLRWSGSASAARSPLPTPWAPGSCPPRTAARPSGGSPSACKWAPPPALW
jgi:MFS family permease